MGVDSTVRWELLEQASPKLFLLGGTLIVGHAAIRGLEAFTAITPPVDIFAPTGYLLALVGVLGLYPSLRTQTPRLARVASATAVVPLGGWVTITVASVGELTGVLTPDAVVLPGAVFGVHMLGLLLAYTLFGVTVLWGGRHPRAVGVLLLVVPTLFIGIVAGAAVMGPSSGGAFVIGSLSALTHLTIGYSLQTNRGTIDHETATELEVAT